METEFRCGTQRIRGLTREMKRGPSCSVDQHRISVQLRFRGPHRGSDVGKTKRGKGSKWMVVVDGQGIERTFAWFGSFRRLLVRHERLTSMYCSFLYFAAALIALRRF